jgi:hypothetical protein
MLAEMKLALRASGECSSLPSTPSKASRRNLATELDMPACFADDIRLAPHSLTTGWAPKVNEI